MSLEYNKKNIPLAKNLRKNATPQENHLWYDFWPNMKCDFSDKKPLGTILRISIVIRQSWL